MDYEGTVGELYLNLKGDKFLVTDEMEYSLPGMVADINGDGHPDILSGTNGYNKNRFYWFENDGSGGGWERHDVSGTGEVVYPRSVCAVDIDGDGDMDVVGGDGTYSSTPRRIYLWMNTDGTGLNWETIIIDDNLPTAAIRVIPADIDTDSDQDILVQRAGPDGHLVWYENPLSVLRESADTWTEHFIGYKSPQDLCVADINSDGWMDVVNASAGSSKQLSWWENLDGTGENWAERTICNNIDYGKTVDVEDMDGDGDLDVIAAGAYDLYWFENNDGLGTSWTSHQLPGVFIGCETLLSADILGSDRPEILAHYILPKRFVLWERTDEAGLTWRMHVLEHSYWYEGLAVGDLDEDDTLDVVAFESGSRIFWFRLGYPSTGTLTSSILDVNNYPDWQEIQWQDSVPEGTTLRFRVRSSNDPEDMGSWSGYIEEPGSLEGFVDSTHRYFQYRVHMEPSGRFVTPTLYQVLFQWEWLGVEGSSGEPVLHPVANPSHGTAEIRFSLPSSCRVSLVVYDLAGRSVAVPVDGMLAAGEHSVELVSLPSGVYFVRMTAGDLVLRESFVLVGN